MGNEATVLNFPASGGASSGSPSPAGGGALGLAQPVSAPSRVSFAVLALLADISAAPIYDMHNIVKCYRYTSPFDLVCALLFWGSNYLRPKTAMGSNMAHEYPLERDWLILCEARRATSRFLATILDAPPTRKKCTQLDDC